jgi:hypothetical protein
MKRKNKKGEILIENVIFILLNLIFLSILVLFLVKQGSGVVLLERPYAKQVALLIDSARPGMQMTVNFERAMKVSDKNGLDFKDVLKIENNFVYVKLSDKSGHEYHFFNDLDINIYPDEVDGEYNGLYVLNFQKKVAGGINDA